MGMTALVRYSCLHTLFGNGDKVLTTVASVTSPQACSILRIGKAEFLSFDDVSFEKNLSMRPD